MNPPVLKPCPNCRFLTSAIRCPLCGTDMRTPPGDKLNGLLAVAVLTAIFGDFL